MIQETRDRKVCTADFCTNSIFQKNTFQMICFWRKGLYKSCLLLLINNVEIHVWRIVDCPVFTFHCWSSDIPWISAVWCISTFLSWTAKVYFYLYPGCEKMWKISTISSQEEFTSEPIFGPALLGQIIGDLSVWIFIAKYLTSDKVYIHVLNPFLYLTMWTEVNHSDTWT